MNLEERIVAFGKLASFMRQVENLEMDERLSLINEKFFDDFMSLIASQHIHNPWYTEIFVKQAVVSIANMLQEENLRKWLAAYSLNEKKEVRVGVVLAGNIPLVGFHDFLCVLITGNIFVGKMSSKDNKLLVFLSKILVEIEPGFSEKIYLEEEYLKNFDAVIATGSDNSARYFNHYFGKYPHIIRKNRTSIAVLDGSESVSDFKTLADDIFFYFGLGCRNVSKLYVPKGFSFIPMLDAMMHYSFLINHNKYANNYDYHRSVFLLNKIKHLDTGFLLLKEDAGMHSPVSVVYFEYYENQEELGRKLSELKDYLQCIVGKNKHASVPFGKTQFPSLWDYADGVDVIDFLNQL